MKKNIIRYYSHKPINCEEQRHIFSWQIDCGKHDEDEEQGSAGHAGTSDTSGCSGYPKKERK